MNLPQELLDVLPPEMVEEMQREMAKEALAVAITDLTENLSRISTVFRGTEPGFDQTQHSPESIMKEELTSALDALKNQPEEERTYKNSVKTLLRHFLTRIK